MEVKIAIPGLFTKTFETYKKIKAKEIEELKAEERTLEQVLDTEAKFKDIFLELAGIKPKKIEELEHNLEIIGHPAKNRIIEYYKEAERVLTENELTSQYLIIIEATGRIRNTLQGMQYVNPEKKGREIRAKTILVDNVSEVGRNWKPEKYLDYQTKLKRIKQ